MSLRLLAFLSACVLAFASGCGRQTATLPSHHGYLRAATYADPSSLNPILATNTSENFLASLAFDFLVTVDDKGKDVPDLAAEVPTLENGGIAKDGKTITYTLRRGVKWQDGAPFSSADVKFSWQAIMNPQNNVVERRGYDDVSSVDVPDDYTVVFHLKRAFAPFVDTVFGESDDGFRVIPRHLLANYPNLNRVPFNALPIGTGPFKVVRWVRDDHIDYVANPQYFRGKPRLDRIRVSIIADDNTKNAEIRSHQLDLIVDLSSASYRDLQGVPDVKTVLVDAPSYVSISMNLTHPPLDDVRVRQAIAYAVDERRIVDTLTYGTGTLATEDLSPYYWAYDPNVTRYPFEPARANALLDAAGWRRGANGIRTKGGRPLSLQIVYGQGNVTAEQLGVAVQSYLKRVGIDAPIKTYNYTTLFATKEMGGIYNGGKFDLALYSWVAGADPDDSSQWMCALTPPAGNNITHYCNPKMDAAQRLALTHFDRTTRKTAYATAQELLARDVPAAFQYYLKRRYAISSGFQHFTPNGISEGWNAYEWAI